MSEQRFSGTERYVATEDLTTAVNAAVTLGRPILIKGEPGTGKTQLAEEIARGLNRPLLQWHVKSTTKAQQGLYEYDAVARLQDSQLGDERVHDIANYIVKGPMWEAFEQEQQPVLLIDEIDKADIEFPNDLLRELDQMEFYVYETHQPIVARHRPIIVITSNNEKELPDAFLRRCFFHYIRFPDKETMVDIVDVHYPVILQNLTLIGALCPKYFENKAIVICKTTNEYFQYLFEPWNCLYTKSVPQGSLSGLTGPHLLGHSQIHLQYMYATDQRGPYSTRSFRSTGLSFKLS